MSTEHKNRFLMIGAVIAAVALILGGLLYFKYRNIISTDDAFVDGRIVPISSKVAGQVVSVSVKDNQLVKQGEILAEIDPVPFRVALDEERAKLASAEVEAKRSASDVVRYREIFSKDEISRQQLDNAEAAATAARAAVEREKAAFESAQLDVSYAKITAPQAGRVTRKSVEPGMYVQVGQSLLSLVPSEVWITANFKETQLTDIREGQPVTIKVDAYPGHDLRGHVDSIQLGTGARFSLFPPENATGNFVKVVQRVPVKIVIDAEEGTNSLLAPGMSVEASVKIR